MKKIFTNSKTYYWLIPISIALLIIIRFYSDKFNLIDKNEFINIISIAAILFTISGFIAAFVAQKKSSEIQKDLIEFGLINNPKESFEVIFTEDLIPSLQSAKRYTGSKVYLLLSSPAYGYPVTTNDTYHNFKDALFDLDSTNTVELMYFCPDSHFDYWSNVVLWDQSANKYLFPNKEQISINFAKEIIDTLKHIEGKSSSYKLYIKKEISIRLYGFDFGRRIDSLSTEIPVMIDKVYLCMVDPFNIVLSQIEISKARHIQLPSRNIAEYIGTSQESLFERLKQCPYRMTKYAGAEVNKGNIFYLLIDYVFGLTSPGKIVTLDWFLSEFELFFENYKKTQKIELQNKDDSNLLKDIVNNILAYYCEIIKFLNGQYGFELKYLKDRIGFLLSIIKDVSSMKDENTKSIFCFNCDTEINTIINSHAPYKIRMESTEENLLDYLNKCDSDEDKFKKTIYYLLYSGLGKSQYYKKLMDIKSQ